MAYRRIAWHLMSRHLRPTLGTAPVIGICGASILHNCIVANWIANCSGADCGTSIDILRQKAEDNPSTFTFYIVKNMKKTWRNVKRVSLIARNAVLLVEATRLVDNREIEQSRCSKWNHNWINHLSSICVIVLVAC